MSAEKVRNLRASGPPSAILALLLALVLANDGQAQTPPALTVCSSANSSSSVRGRVFSIHGGDVAFHGSVRLVGSTTSCSLTPSEDGGFEFRGIPEGQYQLIAQGSSEYEPHAPIPVVMSQGAVLRFDIPVQLRDPLPNCRTNAACLTVLTRRPPEELSGAAQRSLQLFLYRLGIVLAGRDWSPTEPAWVACVEDDDAVTPLRAVYPDVAPMEECLEPDPRVDDPERSQWRHSPSGKPARVILVELPDQLPDGAVEATVTFVAGSRSGAAYACVASWSRGAWFPVRCQQSATF